MQERTKDYSTKEKLDMVLFLSRGLGLRLRDKENKPLSYYFDHTGEYFLNTEESHA